MLTCNPVPFEDPKPDVDEILSNMVARINGEQALLNLGATEYEKKPTHMRRFIVKGQYDLETALSIWKEWVQWRHANQIDYISEEEVAYEKQEGVLAWRGQNKEKMKCCVITGRCLDPVNRRGTHRSFKRFFMKSIEDGLKAVDDDEQDKVCFIYDRRGLEFKHIDPNLFTFCKKVGEEMRDWYSERVGVIYILHMNFFFWIFYSILIQPALSLLNPNFNKKFIMVDTPEELLQYFDEEDLLLTHFGPEREGEESAGEDSDSAVILDNDRAAAVSVSADATSAGENNSNSSQGVEKIQEQHKPAVDMRR